MVLVLSFQDPSSPGDAHLEVWVVLALGAPAQGRAGVGGRGAPPLSMPRGAEPPPTAPAEGGTPLVLRETCLHRLTLDCGWSL